MKQIVEAAGDENPCLVCAARQQCCSELGGLWLSGKEFERLFRRHADDLDVLRYRKVYIARSRNNAPCPYWRAEGCRIYGERPIDCRLYPFEITKLVERRKSVMVRFSANPGCPEKDRLLASVEEARSLIASFCRDVYGPWKRLDIEYEELHADGPLLSLVKPWIARISRALRTRRK